MSNYFMPVTIVTIWLVLLIGCSCAQSIAQDAREKETIQRTKRLLVSSVDRSLPKVSLEYFLKYESAGADIHWEVNDCGEQSGNAEVDISRDFPMCVEADFDSNHRSVSVMIAVGTSKKGVSGRPALFSATITDPDGKTKSLRQLGDLPKELQRRLPKSPRDLPDGREA
jgi:hypothetical protein